MKQSAAIIGAGGGLGAALMRRFAAEGLHTIGLKRDPATLAKVVAEIQAAGAMAGAEALDATQSAQVESMLAQIEQRHGPLALMVFNVAALARNSILDQPVQEFRDMLERVAVAGYASIQAALRLMLVRKRGTILITGATASIKGSAGFSAFAAAKHALRAIALSAAREFGPQGIHVAHVVVDGLIDGPRTDPTWLEGLGEDGALNPDALASLFWNLHQQPRTAWTFEADVRPFRERW
jgi:NAD(P)-dependent dehydrogenase (short-subunit alcohol dehydrogenase family)